VKRLSLLEPIQRLFAHSASGEHPLPEISDAEKIGKLPWVYAFGVFNGLSGAFLVFGSFFMLFLAELGVSKVRMGMLLSILPLCGLLALVVGPHVARLGVKRVFVVLWTLRYFFLLGLVVTPWTMKWRGVGFTSAFIAGILITFGIVRAVAETGYDQWFQEFVPESVRGRYFGTSALIAVVVGMISSFLAGQALKEISGLSGYILMFAVGVLIGWLQIPCVVHFPGGEPRRDMSTRLLPDWRALVAPLRDPNLRNFLLSVTIPPLISAGPFMTLFYKDYLGLKPGDIVQLAIYGQITGFLMTYPSGWLADRFGGKRMYLFGTILSWVTIPAFMFYPRDNPTACYWIIAGVSVYASIFGSLAGPALNRLIWASVIPKANRVPYTMVRYAWLGLMGALSPIISSWELEFLQTHWRGPVCGVDFGEYTLFFFISPIFSIVGLLFIAMITPDQPSIGKAAPAIG
jgi:MFS family permease